MKVILTKEKDLQVPIMLESQAVANRILDSVYPLPPLETK